MNMDDLKIEPVAEPRIGMQPTTVPNGIRVTHLPTGIVAVVPPRFTRTQGRNLNVALAMILAALEAREAP
jgi:protein subunit release factor A